MRLMKILKYGLHFEASPIVCAPQNKRFLTPHKLFSKKKEYPTLEWVEMPIEKLIFYF